MKNEGGTNFGTASPNALKKGNGVMFVNFQIALVLECLYQMHGRRIFAEALEAPNLCFVIMANDTEGDPTIH